MNDITFIVKNRNTFSEIMEGMVIKPIFMRRKPSKIPPLMILLGSYIICLPLTVTLSLILRMVVINIASHDLITLGFSMLFAILAILFWNIFVVLGFLITMLGTIYLMAMLAFFIISRDKSDSIEVIFKEDSMEIHSIKSTQNIIVPYIFIEKISKSRHYLYIQSLGWVAIRLDLITDQAFIPNLLEALK